MVLIRDCALMETTEIVSRNKKLNITGLKTDLDANSKAQK
jgi:hypothetical protein